MNIIILFGPPGSGKGTQAKLLAQKLNLLHVSTGDLLRAEVTKQNELGIKIKTIMEKGELISDEIILLMIKEFLIANHEKDILLDGFPRTLVQSSELIKITEELNVTSLKVINLQLEDNEIISRLLLRAEIEGRADDNLETIKERLKVYSSQTKPVLDFFKSKNIVLLDINGKGRIEEIQKEIIEKLI